MPYTTEAKIRELWNTYVVTDCADDDLNAAADTGVIAAVIEATDEELGSYVCVRFPDLTPDYTGTMPLVIVRQATKFAIAGLLQRGGRPYKELRDEVIAWGEKLAEGKVTIRGITESSLPDSTSRLVELEFSPKSMDDFGEPSPRLMSTGDENDPRQATDSDDD